MRRAAAVAGVAFVLAWTGWSVLHTAQYLAAADYATLLRSAPDPGISGPYLAVAAAESRTAGPVGVVWNLPGDHDYWHYWFEYQFYPGRVTFYPSLPDATRAAPRYLVVVGLPGDVPVDPAGYDRISRDAGATALITAYAKRAT